ncbi:MAG: DNA repair protein RadC [Anaerolineales bacterium]|nr:DNA repair protein RadC [Anaerolineales bacterium]
MCQLLLLPDKPGNTKYTPKHKLLPLRERPVERVSARADACTIVELLAAILGGPQPIETADALLAHFNGRLSDLRRAPAHEIADIPGIGQQNAARIKAAVELGLRLTLNTEEDRPTIHSPADAAAMLQHEMSALEQEHLRVILLDTRNRVIDIVEIYHGSLNSAQVRVAELFKPAIQRMAAAIILIHNHPSGDPSPSPDDVAVTRAVVQAGKLLDIDTLDHLVIGHGRFVSLKERGLGFDGRVSETIPGYRLRRSTRYSIQEDDDLIYAYTRSQALEDGVLVDVSQMAGEAGFRFPTAITADLHARITPNEREKALGQSYDGRLWDVVFLASFTARRLSMADRGSFDVSLFEADDAPPHRTHRRTLSLWMVVGPGDQGEPVITIGFPEDF